MVHPLHGTCAVSALPCTAPVVLTTEKHCFKYYCCPMFVRWNEHLALRSKPCLLPWQLYCLSRFSPLCHHRTCTACTARRWLVCLMTSTPGCRPATPRTLLCVPSTACSWGLWCSRIGTCSTASTLGETGSSSSSSSSRADDITPVLAACFVSGLLQIVSFSREFIESGQHFT